MLVGHWAPSVAVKWNNKKVALFKNNVLFVLPDRGSDHVSAGEHVYVRAACESRAAVGTLRLPRPEHKLTAVVVSNRRGRSRVVLPDRRCCGCTWRRSRSRNGQSFPWWSKTCWISPRPFPDRSIQTWNIPYRRPAAAAAQTAACSPNTGGGRAPTRPAGAAAGAEGGERGRCRSRGSWWTRASLWINTHWCSESVQVECDGAGSPGTDEKRKGTCSTSTSARHTRRSLWSLWRVRNRGEMFTLFCDIEMQTRSRRGEEEPQCRRVQIQLL